MVVEITFDLSVAVANFLFMECKFSEFKEAHRIAFSALIVVLTNDVGD